MKKAVLHGDTTGNAEVKGNRIFRGACYAAVVCGLCLPLAFAAKIDSKRAELKDVRGRIGALQQDVARNEAAKTQAAEELRKLDAAIAATSRELDELAQNRAHVQGQLDDLNRQSAQLTGQIDLQQKQISRLLYRQFVSGNDDALHVLLSGGDPNKAARERYFLTLVSREKGEMLDDLRGSLKEKQRLADAARDKSAELAAIARQQEQQRAALQARQKERQVLLAKVSDQIKAQKRQIATLKENEKRLSSLIDNLTRQAARAPQQKKRGTAPAPVPSPRTPPPREPDLGDARGAFASLRGQLALPVAGDIVQRFGAPRGEGGGIWKGLFIRCAPGSDVRAIADGIVVYADWLRGYGNLVIIDHGDGFLSVYGNNQSLTRRTGASVKARDPIATAGTDDAAGESGLYFELRHQGQPFDPLRWMRLK